MRQSGASQPLLINMYLPGTRDQLGAGGTGTRGWKSNLGRGKGIVGVQREGCSPEIRMVEGLSHLGRWRTAKADGELWGFHVRSRRLEVSRLGDWEAEGASSGAERACGGTAVFDVVGTRCACSAGRLESAGRRPCTLVAPHLRAPRVPTGPAFQAPSSSLRRAPRAPASQTQPRLGFIRLPPARSESGFPFSWTRFLTWALWRGSARRAPARARLREEEPGSSGPQPHAPSGALAPGPFGSSPQPPPRSL